MPTGPCRNLDRWLQWLGAAGIGKTRLAGEVVQLAKVVVSRCFPPFVSHTPPVSRFMWWRVCCARLGRSAVWMIRPRARVRAQVPDANPEHLLLDDLLGIADPEVALPKIAAAAVDRADHAASLARTDPAIFVVEDVHRIDAGSESMIADFVALIARTHAMVLVTYRPEYRGAVSRVAGGQTIALATERCGNRNAGRRTAGPRSVGG